MNLSKVTVKGQVTLPADLRKRFGIEQGKRVTFVAARGGILVKPVAVRDLTREPKWKKDLTRALADAKAGRVRRFLSDEGFLGHLERDLQESKRAAKKAKR